MLCQGCSWHAGIPLRRQNVSLQQHSQTRFGTRPRMLSLRLWLFPRSKITALLLLSMAWQIFLQLYSSTGYPGKHSYGCRRQAPLKALCYQQPWYLGGIERNKKTRLLVACVWVFAQVMVNKHSCTVTFVLPVFS